MNVDPVESEAGKAVTAGRPRSFDEDETLQRVLDVFWVRGYEASSYPALEEATGLRRQSLRYAFGDKDAMFLKALSRYADRRVGEFAVALSSHRSPFVCLEAAFAIWVKDAEDPRQRGCMVVNTLAEASNVPAEALVFAQTAARRLIKLLEKTFRAGQVCGEVATKLSPKELAVIALTLGDGLTLHGRSGAATSSPARVTASFLKQLKP